MSKYKDRSKGDTFRPITKVLKVNNGMITKILLNGQEYALVHPNYINGNKNKFKS